MDQRPRTTKCQKALRRPREPGTSKSPTLARRPGPQRFRWAVLGAVFAASLGIGLSGCGETKPANSVKREDPAPPPVMVRMVPDEIDRDLMREVCVAYQELEAEDVPRDERLHRTAERALLRGGQLVRIFTEQWGTLLPAELYLQLRALAGTRAECTPFISFLRDNAEASQDAVAAYRNEVAQDKAQRIASARVRAKGLEDVEALQSLPADEPTRPGLACAVADGHGHPEESGQRSCPQGPAPPQKD